MYFTENSCTELFFQVNKIYMLELIGNLRNKTKCPTFSYPSFLAALFISPVFEMKDSTELKKIPLPQKVL